jgi:hypothetical protein
MQGEQPPVKEPPVQRPPEKDPTRKDSPRKEPPIPKPPVEDPPKQPPADPARGPIKEPRSRCVRNAHCWHVMPPTACARLAETSCQKLPREPQTRVRRLSDLSRMKFNLFPVADSLLTLLPVPGCARAFDVETHGVFCHNASDRTRNRPGCLFGS